MEDNKAVTVEYTGKTAIITLNNPKKLNALGQDDYYCLATLLRQIARHNKVLVTLLIGKGRFFSAGADVARQSPNVQNLDARRHWLPALTINNIELADAFYSHPKILVTGLNGPAIGLSAAIVAHSDLIFATREAFLLTPFSSLGLVTEGGASVAFVRRLGISKAKEALLFSRKITAEELLHTGFVNKIIDPPDDGEEFRQLVLAELESRVGDHLVGSSILEIKKLIREPGGREFNDQAVKEFLGGLRRFAEGVPQAEFEKVASGKKRHKL